MALLITPSAASACAETSSPGKAAAGWLARQLVDGERFETVWGDVAYPDQGLTIDAVLAFAATKSSDDSATAAMAWLETSDILSGYVGDGVTESYAGATAKLAFAVDVRGGDPTAFGGIDLVDRLLALQDDSGRFSDASAWGDYSNVFGQSFAVLALDRTDAGAPATAVSYLAGNACDDGGFPTALEPETCTSDVDATAMAVQALLAAGDTATAEAGADWLESVQQDDGGFAGSDGTVNANSSGLAAQALRATGRYVPSFEAKAYLLTLQVGCDGDEADRGAIDYDGGDFDASTAPRATAQAVLGLARTSLGSLSAAGSAAEAPVLACS